MKYGRTKRYAVLLRRRRYRAPARRYSAGLSVSPSQAASVASPTSSPSLALVDSADQLLRIAVPSAWAFASAAFTDLLPVAAASIA